MFISLPLPILCEITPLSMVQVAIGASYSVLKTPTSQTPAFLSAPIRATQDIRALAPLVALSHWLN